MYSSNYCLHVYLSFFPCFSTTSRRRYMQDQEMDRLLDELIIHDEGPFLPLFQQHCLFFFACFANSTSQHLPIHCDSPSPRRGKSARMGESAFLPRRTTAHLNKKITTPQTLPTRARKTRTRVVEVLDASLVSPPRIFFVSPHQPRVLLWRRAKPNVPQCLSLD
ncbi:unnamed protein product [Periconia digitata]|uniref:Uncharacterized protein n=1 Tax=Periconia digitata TaxID=1303443 RepID=A0A9W4U4A9_9PLEO|nr:unnamed protein product [Periconia digitata]